MALPPREIGRRLRTAREELGLSVDELAHACGTSVNVFTSLEEGTLDPVPGDYLLIAARLMKTDFRSFISSDLDDVDAETRRLFRALESPRPRDLLSIRRFMHFCTAEREIETLLDIKRPELPPTYPRGHVRLRAKDQGKQAAGEERERLRLAYDPIPNVFSLLRQQNVRLFRHAMEDGRLSGVTVAHPKAGLCVLVNYDEDLYRQFFSAAHEYAHVLFDRTQIATDGHLVSYRFSAKQLVEIRANAFAGEFLLPEAALARYARPRNVDDVATQVGVIARDYRVNGETVAIRMKESGWISEKTLASFKMVRPVTIRKREKIDPDVPRDLTDAQMARREAATKEGISSYFLELLRRGLTEDAITFGRFSEMLDMSVSQAREFLHSTGMAV